MSDNPVRYCEVCGKKLKRKNLKYCSEECHNKKKAETEVIYKCKVCGKPIRTTGGTVRKYCSNACCYSDRKGKKINRGVVAYADPKNRPFTPETGYLIRLWYRKGDSKEQIAQALGRSLKNIEQAFV